MIWNDQLFATISEIVCDWFPVELGGVVWELEAASLLTVAPNKCIQFGAFLQNKKQHQ